MTGPPLDHYAWHLSVREVSGGGGSHPSATVSIRRHVTFEAQAENRPGDRLGCVRPPAHAGPYLRRYDSVHPVAARVDCRPGIRTRSGIAPRRPPGPCARSRRTRRRAGRRGGPMSATTAVVPSRMTHHRRRGHSEFSPGPSPGPSKLADEGAVGVVDQDAWVEPGAGHAPDAVEQVQVAAGVEGDTAHRAEHLPRLAFAIARRRGRLPRRSASRRRSSAGTFGRLAGPGGPGWRRGWSRVRRGWRRRFERSSLDNPC